MWIPLTFWAVHRVIDAPSARRGALAGAFLFLQVISCVYYGVFLAIASAALVLLLTAFNPKRIMAAVPALAVAGVVALVLIAPYGWQYVKTARLLGTRELQEV